MKKLLTILMVVILSAAFTLLVPQQLQAKKIVSAEKNSFANVTKHLDKGGGFYMYMSAEKFIKFLENLMAVIKQVAISEAKNPAEKQEIETGINLVSRLLKNSGLFEISGIGMSSVVMKNGFNHNKTVVHHYKDKGSGLIWHLCKDRPHAFDSQELLPANTVFAGFSDNRLAYLWHWIQKEAAASGIPKLQKGIGMVGAMLKSKGIDLEKLLDSMAGKSGIILTLDETKMCKVPVKNMMLEFPDPALALVFYVKNDSIFQLLQKFIPAAAQVDGKVKKLVGPLVPLPITLNPQVVLKDNLLIFASNGKIADEILSGKKGLKGSAEFKNLSLNMPREGNSYTFWSSKIFKTIADVRSKVVTASSEKEKAMYAALKRLNMFPENLAFYRVKQNTAEGFIYSSNDNMPLGGSGAAVLPALAVGGIVAAIAIPNLLSALQRGKQKATMADMKAISQAINAYIETKGIAPVGKTIEEIRPHLEPYYIKKLPLKDAWGHYFLYKHGSGDKKDQYCIGSGGKNGVFKGWEQKGFYISSKMSHFDKDIIICNGEFIFGNKLKK